MKAKSDPGFWNTGPVVEGDFRIRLLNQPDPGRRMEIIREVLCPPEPQLLDTSVLQNLDWINRLIESEGGEVYWDDHAVARLEERYGKALADDLIDLGTLYKRFEHYGEYPWLICNAAVDEAGILQNEKGERVRQLISFLSGHQDDCAHDSYTGVSLGLLLARGASRPSPLILRALGVARREEVYAVGGAAFILARSGRSDACGSRPAGKRPCDTDDRSKDLLEVSA